MLCRVALGTQIVEQRINSEGLTEGLTLKGLSNTIIYTLDLILCSTKSNTNSVFPVLRGTTFIKLCLAPFSALAQWLRTGGQGCPARPLQHTLKLAELS